MGRANNPHCKVRCIETGEIFNSVSEAANSVKRCTSAISQAISKGSKSAGYHWEKVEEKEYAIYKLTLPDGKVYIGQTNLRVKQRWARGRNYKNSNPRMYEAIMASGWDNVLHEVIERVDTREEALARERYYILQYKSNEPEYGFNTITNLTSCGTEEEILAHRRAYNRKKNKMDSNPFKIKICKKNM